MTKFKKIIACILFLCFMVWVPLCAFDKISMEQNKVKKGYKGVLNLWHIETFEGGSGSRANFLKRRAIEFESQNKGVFVSVQTYTPEQVLQKLNDGAKFDIISFSYGVGCDILNLLSPYSGKVNVRDDLLQGGTIKGDIFALPWAFGGYTLCAFNDVLTKIGGILSVSDAFEYGYVKKDKNKTKIPSLGVGFAQYTNPFQPLADKGVSGKKDEWTNDMQMTSYQAYQGFCDKKFALLLGTQRDLSRILQKQSQGKMQEVSFEFLSGYTDLVQYVSFCDNGQNRGKVSQDFIEYLTSDKSQKKLGSIEMFSPSLDLYDSGLHLDMQKALSTKLTVPNVFADKTVLANQRQSAMQRLGI